jgi:hypothetical protein
MSNSTLTKFSLHQGSELSSLAGRGPDIFQKGYKITCGRQLDIIIQY